MAPFVGEFDVDPETIEEVALPPKDQELILNVEKAERKVAPKTGNAFISMVISVVDIPNSKIFQSFFLTADALATRSAAISYKKFLSKLGLPYTTVAADLINLRFKGKLKHEGTGDEAQARLADVVGVA